MCVVHFGTGVFFLKPKRLEKSQHLIKNKREIINNNNNSNNDNNKDMRF